MPNLLSSRKLRLQAQGLGSQKLVSFASSWLLLLSISLLSSIVYAEPQDDAAAAAASCLDNVQPTVIVSQYRVFFNTTIYANTTLSIGPNASLIIDSAPTFLYTTATFTQYLTTRNSLPAPLPSPLPSPSPGPSLSTAVIDTANNNYPQTLKFGHDNEIGTGLGQVTSVFFSNFITPGSTPLLPIASVTPHFNANPEGASDEVVDFTVYTTFYPLPVTQTVIGNDGVPSILTSTSLVWTTITEIRTMSFDQPPTVVSASTPLYSAVDNGGEGNGLLINIYTNVETVPLTQTTVGVDGITSILTSTMYVTKTVEFTPTRSAGQPPAQSAPTLSIGSEDEITHTFIASNPYSEATPENSVLLPPGFFSRHTSMVISPPSSRLSGSSHVTSDGETSVAATSVDPLFTTDGPPAVDPPIVAATTVDPHFTTNGPPEIDPPIVAATTVDPHLTTNGPPEINPPIVATSVATSIDPHFTTTNSIEIRSSTDSQSSISSTTPITTRFTSTRSTKSAAPSSSLSIFQLVPGANTTDFFGRPVRRDYFKEQMIEPRQDNQYAGDMLDDQYVNGAGALAAPCQAGSFFAISGSVLTTGYGEFASPPDVDWYPFTASNNSNATLNSFFSVQNRVIVWENPVFENGRARFCNTTDGNVMAIFRGPVLTNCTLIDLVLDQASPCGDATTLFATPPSITPTQVAFSTPTNSRETTTTEEKTTDEPTLAFSLTSSRLTVTETASSHSTTTPSQTSTSTLTSDPNVSKTSSESGEKPSSISLSSLTFISDKASATSSTSEAVETSDPNSTDSNESRSTVVFDTATLSSSTPELSSTTSSLTKPDTSIATSRDKVSSLSSQSSTTEARISSAQPSLSSKQPTSSSDVQTIYTSYIGPTANSATTTKSLSSASNSPSRITSSSSSKTSSSSSRISQTSSYTLTREPLPTTSSSISRTQFYTVTSYVYNNDDDGPAYTSTYGWEVVIGHARPRRTFYTAVALSGPGYTSTIRGSGTNGAIVIIATPISVSYSTRTSYFYGGEPEYTRTSGSIIEIGRSIGYTTVTSNIDAFSTAFTTTVLPSGSLPGTIIFGVPRSVSYSTSTTFLGNGETPYTSTSRNNVIVGIAAQTTTITTNIDPFSPAYTSTISASGSIQGTVIIGSPATVTYYTVITYLAAGVPFTSTSRDQVLIGVQASSTPSSSSRSSNRAITTVTTIIDAFSSAYTSTISAQSSNQGTVLVGQPGSVKYRTSTSWLDNGEAEYTSTSRNLVLIGIRVSTTTVTRNLLPFETGYTTTIPARGSQIGTVIHATPGPYSTLTTYLNRGETGFTSTSSGFIFIGSPIDTITTTSTLPPFATAYISTELASATRSGTVIVGIPGQYTTSTEYLDFGQRAYTSTSAGYVFIGELVSTVTSTSNLPPFETAYVSTVRASGRRPGTVIYGVPGQFSTLTDYLYNGETPYTSTSAGNVLIGQQVSTVTSTSTLSPLETSYVRTISANGRTPGTVIYGIPGQFSTLTNYLYNGETPYTSTSAGNVFIGQQASTVTSTSKLSPFETSYVSTISADGRSPGTVIYGVPGQYSTLTKYLYNGETPYTTTSYGNIMIGKQVSTVRYTSTLPPYENPYISTVSASGGTPATIVYGVPAQYKTSTDYLHSGESPYTSTLSGNVMIGQQVSTMTWTSTLAPFENAYISTVLASGRVPGTVIYGVPGQYTTLTEYLYSGESPYTSTVSGNVMIGQQAFTTSSTQTIQPYESPFTSTVPAVGPTPATIIFGSPAQFTTSTSYLDNGESAYTSTSAGLIIVGDPVGTVITTSTLSAFQSAFTSTVRARGSTRGTVIIGSPVDYTTLTTYLYDGEMAYTSTVQGTIVIGNALPTVTTTTPLQPFHTGYTSTFSASGSVQGTVLVGVPNGYTTTTKYLDGGEPAFTSTSDGNVIIGQVVPTSTITSYLPPYESPYSSTVSASGSLPGTVIIGSPAFYSTKTTYLHGGEPAFTSTSAGDIIIGQVVSTSTVVNTIPPYETPYSSTIPASGSVPGTVFIGSPALYTTQTSYLIGGESAFTSTSSGNIIIGQVVPTSTVVSNLAPYDSAYTSTYSAYGSIPGTVIIGSPAFYTTQTSYLYSGESAYTSTILGNIFVGQVITTVTTIVTIQPFDSAYTSTQSAVGSTPGTVYIGSPAQYTTSTTYLYDSGVSFTSTTGGMVLIGQPVPTVTVTTTVQPFETIYTSTVSASGSVPGTVILATQAPYTTSTSYLDETEAPYTSTSSGLIVIGSPISTPTITSTLSAYEAGYTSSYARVGSQLGSVLIGAPVPYQTVTSYINDPNRSEFTSTSQGFVIIGSQVSTISSTSTLSAGSSAYTSTVSASGSIPGTIIYGSPVPYTTSTSYINDPNQGTFTTTSAGFIIIGSPVSTVSTTSSLPAESAAYTSTVSANGSTPGTVIYGIPVPYTTTTSYFNDPARAAFVSTSAGYVVVGSNIDTVTQTSTLPPDATGYTSTFSGSGSIPPSVVYGTPAPYTTISTYYNDASRAGFTSTSAGYVVIGYRVDTVTQTSTLPPDATGYTSTFAGSGSMAPSVIVGTPLPYTTVTTFIDDGAQNGYVTTQGHTVIIRSKMTTVTRTTTVPAYSSGFTSTISFHGPTVTVLVASPSQYLTSTSYIYDPAEPGYTSTSDGIIIIATLVDTITTTTTLPPYATGFTSTVSASGSTSGTVIIGSPAQYTTQTTYNQVTDYTSTESGNIIIGVQGRTTTTTSTLPPDQSLYTSTVPGSGSIPGTVIIGTPLPYSTQTSYGQASDYTSTVSGNVFIGVQARTTTTTSTLPPYQSPYSSTVPESGSMPGTVIIGTPAQYTTKTFYGQASEYTSTESGNVLIGIQARTTTTTSTLPPYQSPYSSTIPESGSIPGTVIIGTPAQYTTQTSYRQASDYTSTESGNVVIGVQARTTTTTTTLPPYQSPYSSTISETGSLPGTVIIGTPAQYSTQTSYGQAFGYTSTSGDVVIIGVQRSTVFSTTTVQAHSPGFTSTYSNTGSTPDTILVGEPAPYSTSTSYLYSGSGFTSTQGENVVIGAAVQTTTSTVAPNSAGYTSTYSSGNSGAPYVVIGTPGPYSSSTSYLYSGSGYTSTQGGNVVIGSPVQTTTSTVAPNSPGYTSTYSSGTSGVPYVVIATPGQFTTRTSYLYSGEASYASTSAGDVVVGTPVQTVTSTVAPNSAAYTSTYSSGSSAVPFVVVGTPGAYTTRTSYLYSGEAIYTSTSAGNVVVGTPVQTVTSTVAPNSAAYTSTYSSGPSAAPYVVVGTPGAYTTRTSYLYNGEAIYTSTSAGNVVVGTPVQTVTSTVAPNSAGYTSTYSSGTSGAPYIIIASPGQYTTQTSYLYGGESPYTSTSGGNVVVGTPARTTTSTLPPNSAAYTTTVSSEIPYVVIGTPGPYTTQTSYLYSGENPYTSTSAGNVVIGTPVRTTTTTLAPNSAAFTSTASSETPYVVVGSPAQYSTITSTVAPDSAAYTRTVTSGTPYVVVGSPGPYTTTTSYLYGGESTYTSTSAGNVIIGARGAGTVTTTTFLETTYSAYTSTQSASGTTSGTVVVGYPLRYTTVVVTSGTTGRSSTLATASGTATGTIQLIYPTPAACSNGGIQWAIQNNPYTRGLNAADPTYSMMGTAAFQTSAPVANGVANYIAVTYTATGATANNYIYGTGPRTLDKTGVNHRGYLFAKQSGTYSFNMPTSDDITMLWVGSNAYGPSYTRASANIVQLYNSSAGAAPPFVYSLYLDQGQYVPFRVLWANWLYGAGLSFTISAPDGTVITNGTSGYTTPYLVQFSCDGTTAKRWPSWGAEG
ncbi:cell surface parotein [Phlyctema vagabunda]|uniref:Cell surface parotein n=1 Tax=Phlyctema vagabunda TaxID=108571 RepID=A0ABR4PE91_9HELO